MRSTVVKWPSPWRHSVIKDIAVQLTGSDEDEVRLQFAQSLVSRYDAHLVGMHLHTLPDILDITEPTRSAAIQTLLEESNAAYNQHHEQLKNRLAKLHGSTELRRLDGMTGDVGLELSRLARQVDLFIGTRPYGDPEAKYRIEEAALFGSGRGCLFLPPGGATHKTFRTILIAWDGSREAARAVAEAMPLLTDASKVYVGQIVDPGQSPLEAERQFGGINAHLERYGVDATLSQVDYRYNTGEQILEMAHQKGADLVVMGAYGHSRFLEWALGGATRYLLRYSTLPLLMAH